MAVLTSLQQEHKKAHVNDRSRISLDKRGQVDSTTVLRFEPVRLYLEGESQGYNLANYDVVPGNATRALRNRCASRRRRDG